MYVRSQHIPFKTSIEYEPQEMLEPSPEQVVPAWSLFTYSFMFPVVRKAYQLPLVTFDMLLPLSDFDHVRNLKRRAFKVYWGFICIFHGLMQLFLRFSIPYRVGRVAT